MHTGYLFPLAITKASYLARPSGRVVPAAADCEAAAPGAQFSVNGRLGPDDALPEKVTNIAYYYLLLFRLLKVVSR